MITVLYVDDEPVLLDLAKVFLEQSGPFRVELLDFVGEALNRNMRMQITRALPGERTADPGNGQGSPDARDIGISSGFLPKRMLLIVADDEYVSPVVQAIVNANQTGWHGDGRIFICPMIGAIRVRTGEHGDNALS